MLVAALAEGGRMLVGGRQCVPSCASTYKFGAAREPEQLAATPGQMAAVTAGVQRRTHPP